MPLRWRPPIEEVNIHAREGKDPAFGKGSKAYNRFQGDALNLPNPCVRPLENGAVLRDQARGRRYRHLSPV